MNHARWLLSGGVPSPISRYARTCGLVIVAPFAATAACSALLDLKPPPDAGTPVILDATGADQGPIDAGATDADAEPPTCLALQLDAAAPKGATGSAATYTAIDTASAWESYPLGVSSTGGAFDGRYVYFGPNGNITSRFDTQAGGGFSMASSWSTANLVSLDPNLPQFQGVVFDGRYLYLVPFGNPPMAPSGLVARFDTTGGFAANSGAWTTFDVTTLDAGKSASGFVGGVFDGRFVYLVPNENAGGNDGLVARYDTTSIPLEAGPADAGADAGRTFGSPAAWSLFDLGVKEAGAAAYFGAVYDGARVYLVPRLAHPAAVRSPADAAAFGDAAAWSTFPLETLLIPGTWFYSGGAFDGRYIYFVPRSTGVVLRFDTTDPAGWAPPNGSQGGWSAFDVTQVLPPTAAVANGDAGASWPYSGAGFDGRYIYFVPRGTSVLVRYDTFSTFTAPCAWTAFDLTAVGVPASAPDYYEGAVFDGQYLYLVPNGRQVPALRFDARTPSAMPALPAFHGSFF